MKDIKIDNDLNISFGGNSDMQMVRGRTQFEQSLTLWLTSFFHDEVGELNTSVATERVRAEAERIAIMNNRINDIASIVATESEDIPNSIDVSIVYLTGETFEENLN